MKALNPKFKSLPGGTWIKREVYLSPSWQSLSRNGHRAFMACYDARKMEKTKDKKGEKRSDKKCLNARDLGITHGDFERFGIPRGKVSAAISELMAKGFIELRHSGGARRGDRNIYALSENWRYWKPGSEPCQVRKKREKRGYQGRGLGAIAKWKKPQQGEPQHSAGENLEHQPTEVEQLETKIRDVIKKHPSTRGAKKFWADTVLFDLNDQFHKANAHSLKNGEALLVSLESIYERFLSNPDEIIANIQKRYPYELKRKNHCTQNVEVT
jgi:hypothetical protein